MVVAVVVWGGASLQAQNRSGGVQTFGLQDDDGGDGFTFECHLSAAVLETLRGCALNSSLLPTCDPAVEPSADVV